MVTVAATKKKKKVSKKKTAAKKKQVPFELELIEVGVDDIESNDYNPNVMEEAELRLLSEHIAEDAQMVQPVLLRTNPNKDGPKYMLVDGENRWKGARLAGLPTIVGVVVPYDEDKAKFRTISMNQIRGEYIPLKMAKLLVDLQERYNPETIRQMTGIRGDEMESLTQLLDVPEIDFSTNDAVSTSSIQKSIPVTLLLLHTEHKDYHQAMVDAMALAGPKVVPLVDEDVGLYDKAMTSVMGLEGLKLRNVALASICRVFNAMTDQQKKEILAELDEG